MHNNVSLLSLHITTSNKFRRHLFHYISRPVFNKWKFNNNILYNSLENKHSQYDSV